MGLSNAERQRRHRERLKAGQPLPRASYRSVGSGNTSKAAGIKDAPKETPLFRSALGKQKQLSPRPMSGLFAGGGEILR